MAKDKPKMQVNLPPRVQPIGETIAPHITVCAEVPDEAVLRPHLYQARMSLAVVDGRRVEKNQPAHSVDSVVSGVNIIPLTATFSGRLWFSFENLAFRPETAGHTYHFRISAWQSAHDEKTNIWKQPTLYGETITQNITVVPSGRSVERRVSNEVHEWDMETFGTILGMREREPPLGIEECVALWPQPKAIMHAELDRGPWAATSKSRNSAPS